MAIPGKLVKSIALGAGVGLFAAGPAGAQSFSAPVQLSQHGYAASPMVAIDAGGTALAVWADEGAYYSVHAPGGAWTAPQFVQIAGGGGPTLQMSSAGFATVVSYQSGYGIYAIDRPAGGAWSLPATVVSGVDLITPTRTGALPVIFVGNAAGDQAIVWEQYSNGAQIMAVRRPAGGVWGTAELVASPPAGSAITLASAAIGAGGDVLTAWETFQVVCNRYCHEINFVLHASREHAGATGWSDSGALTPASTTNGYRVWALIDAEGHGGLVYQDGFSTPVQAMRQGVVSGRWSPSVAAFGGGTSGTAVVWGAAAGKGGQAILALANFGTPLQIDVVDGNLGRNAWSAPIDLSVGDNSSGPTDGLAFGANGVGGAVVSWGDQDDTIHVAVRRNGAHGFSAPQTLVAGTYCQVFGFACTGAGVAAINQAGQAVTLIEQVGSDGTNHVLFASAND